MGPGHAACLGDFACVRADYNCGFTLRKMAHIPSLPEQNPAAPTYEDALSELERLVAAMELGQLPLDTLLENYRRGAELLNFCRARLEAVEQQVKVLEEGQLKPWTSA
jgi:exodeoxyribonuclease VII small subunit